MVLKMPAKKPKDRAAMIEYLSQHGRYHTMHSWNCSTSYAYCVKVCNLGLDRETAYACLEMLEVSEAFEEFNRALREFEIRHDYRWQISQNGRSGGYLVLIHGGKHEDGRVFCQPGKHLDMNADFTQWETDDLQDRVNLIWEFDQICESAVAAFVEFAKSHTVAEETVMVPHKIKVAVPKGPALAVVISDT